MSEEFYADGIGEITVTGAIVRIDFVSLSPGERDADGAPKAVFRKRVIMSADGFANAVDLMLRARAGLAEAGTVQQVPAAVPQPVAVASANTAAGQGGHGPNVSPNFN